MKKSMVLCACLCAAMVFTGCKSSESAYKKAYEKAKAQQAVQQQPTVTEQQPETNVVVPLQQTPVTETKVVDNNDNIQVRQEKVSLVDGAGLKEYSVVVGSFGVKANADGLQQRLKDAGYAAQVVKNVDRNMYRVVASTFANKADAAASRDQLRSQYPDAWLLSNAN